MVLNILQGFFTEKVWLKVLIASFHITFKLVNFKIIYTCNHIFYVIKTLIVQMSSELKHDYFRSNNIWLDAF